MVSYAFSMVSSSHSDLVTVSILIWSIICSCSRRTLSIYSFNSPLNVPAASRINSCCACFLKSSMVAGGKSETRHALSVQCFSMISSALFSISSGSKAFINSLVICFRFLPPEYSSSFSFSLSVICLSKRIKRFASERKRSSSSTPIVTAPNKSSSGMLCLRSSGRLSVFLDFVAPTASTITKWVFSTAVLLTCINESLLMLRVPRPFICSK
ncbi:MAG: hypothetical protein BWZ00_01898 [Bacteroidetes bacterium ADurb.BinA174]|nr:MAG: hypothetical protein BWZ00_01898 [Bacteroidetes bacterium ADurb.BinA174]